MLQTTYRHVQELIFSDRPAVRWLALGAAVLAGALLITLLIGVVGPVLALAITAVILAAALILTDTHWGYVGLVAVIFLLPFASLPVSVGVKPTFLDAALGAIFFVWLFKLVIGQQREFVASPLGLLVGVFLILAVFSFANGLLYGPATSFVVRRFLEILIGVSLFFVAVNTIRSPAEIVWVTRWVMLAGWGAAIIAIVFYIIPQDLTVRALDALARFDYPGGSGALRFIEDDPNGVMRAIGTAVDPNVLGGMMILVAALLVPQVAAKETVLPRWLTWIMLGTAAVALYLTYSRSALLGLAAAVAMVGVLKYRRLIPYAVVAALLLLLLPVTQEYVARLFAGIAGEDLATQMRFGEYKDALILIGRYPLFGVGFTGVPDLDVYLGVSMLYLIMAENMGVIGLAVFAAIMVGFFWLVLRSWRRGLPPQLEAVLLGLASAVLGALVSGIFDHYWFNMTYPHMTVLLWLYVGLAMATMLVSDRLQGREAGGEGR